MSENSAAEAVISQSVEQLKIQPAGPKVRCIVQQCTKATLQTRLADPENGIEAETAEVLINWRFFDMNIYIRQGSLN